MIVPASADGSISIFTSDATDFFIDINGYFAPDDGKTGLAYFPITQCTATDSADGLYGFGVQGDNGLQGNTLGGPPYMDGETRLLPIPNFAILRVRSDYRQGVRFECHGEPAWQELDVLDTFSSRGAQPNASQLNDFQGTIVTNSAIVPAGTNGAINLYTDGPTDLSLMISGYFSR